MGSLLTWGSLCRRDKQARQNPQQDKYVQEAAWLRMEWRGRRPRALGVGAGALRAAPGPVSEKDTVGGSQGCHSKGPELEA